jgi:hypothetical protein
MNARTWFSALSALCLVTTAALAQNSDRHWDVLEAGATPDGVTDCTATFQRLLTEAGKAGGGVVEVPAGRYKIATHLSIPANVTLQGIYRVPPTTGPKAITNLTGSVLLAYADRGTSNGPPFIRLAGNNAAIAGLIVAYPEWKQSDVPPIPYPPCVLSQDTENVGVRDCLLLNPYEGIKLVRAHRHIVRNVTGYPIWRGIFVDECYDIGHIENVHFWPFGVSYDPQNAYCKWINTQGTAFELARTDWHYVLNTFCFGYGVGYRFSQSKTGSSNGNFVGLGADSCERAVLVDQAQPPGLLITNGEFVGRWSSTNAVCLEVAPTAEGKVSLVNCSFWGPIDRCVWMRSPAGQFTASACNFVQWDVRGTGSAAIQLDAGKAIIQGCSFGQDNLHLQIGEGVLSAIVMGNQAAGGLRVENHAGKRTQLGLNEEDSISWTSEERASYRLQIGDTGDGRYLQGWHGPERSDRPFRWSMAQSRLMLPVNPGEPYTMTLQLQVPAAARSDHAGVYLDNRRLCGLTNGTTSVSIPAGTDPRLMLEVRSAGWVPQRIIPGSHDQRTLGVQLFELSMRAEGSGKKVFNANTGQWISGDK